MTLPYLGEPKTRQSYRSVAQGRSIVGEIARHREEFTPQVVYIEDRTNRRKPVAEEDRTADMMEATLSEVVSASVG
ncbi:hypothetical protein ACIBJF_11995 [Streptomyces sp. NPDC050743]|uniref:hypothetical protein n=1 Tax=Streptomyces sp. NPDC050743 TaxID=3365634 RepID=UPI00378B6B57